jgi:hypothetical protein
MRVTVVFKFKYVHPDSEQADKIVEEITESCETMRIAFNATECWVDDATADSGKEE